MLLNRTKYVNNPQNSINSNTTLSTFPTPFFPPSFLKVYEIQAWSKDSQRLHDKGVLFMCISE